MDKLKLYSIHYGAAPKGAKLVPEAEALKAKLESFGRAVYLVGDSKNVETLAIEMPSGYPLFLNMRSSYADRKKGYVHLFIMEPHGQKGSFIRDAVRKSEAVPPKNFTVTTMTEKKLNDVINYHEPILIASIAEAAQGRALVAEWRDKIKTSGFTHHFSTIKQNNADNLNVSVKSPCENFEIDIDVSSDHRYVSQTLTFTGSGDYETFLKLCELSEEKAWFHVDFTGLGYTHAGFLCYGSERALKTWCDDTERSLKAIGYHVEPSRSISGCHSTARFVVAV